MREALQRPSAEGLVTITARQGAMVSRTTVEDILEVYGARENLLCAFNDLKAAATMVEFPEEIRASAARKVSSTRCRMGAHRSE